MFEVKIKTGGAAFHDEEDESLDSYYTALELERIFKRIVADIKDGYKVGFCMDINGNKVGTWNLD